MSPISSASPLLRPEQPGDATRIRQINELAFEGTEEADLIEALRASGGIVLSLVAVIGGEKIVEEPSREGELAAHEQPGPPHSGAEIYGGEIVAHALVTPVTVSTEHGEVQLLGLGPVAVLPAEQGKGIGTHLIDGCLEQSRALGYPGMVVMGEPAYFQRFGFIPAGRWGLRRETDAPDEDFMALELSPGKLGGMEGVVRYCPEF